MIGQGYWSPGIGVRYVYVGHGCYGWDGAVRFFDDEVGLGHLATQGMLRSRRGVDAVVQGRRSEPGHQAAHRFALTLVVDTLRADALRLGVQFGQEGRAPAVYLHDEEAMDGSTGHPLPPEWRELMAEQSRRLGWDSPYAGEARP